AVFTVPEYYSDYGEQHPLILNIIQAAKLVDIEIIDIIEETHADLLYYMSNKKYSEKIIPGKNIAIIDIGEGACICKIYEISGSGDKRYATCFMESVRLDNEDDKYSGR